ncbi:MAG: helix-turn-helix transcriptional regulator [Hyphomicrobiaceae bacterium]
MTNFIDSHVGKKIREIRVARNLAPDELASAAGIRISTLEEYEKGSARLPAREMLALTRLLDVDVDAFFNDLSFGDTGNRACPTSSHVAP